MKQRLTPEQIEKVRGVPGLYVADEFVRGAPDAIAAVRFRLGAKVREPQFRKVELNGTSKGLRDYQVSGVQFLASTLSDAGGSLLADDMGLGKTLQSINAWRAQGSGRLLVVAPAAARETWRDELAKWGVHGAAILDSTGTRASKLAWEAAPQAEVVVCSYDHRITSRVGDVAFASEYPTMVILDEAHRIKGRDSKRSKELYELCSLAKYRLAITGTPQYDRLRDFYQLLHTLLGNRFGNRWAFDRAYCGGHVNEWNGWENKGATNTEEFKMRLSHYMIRRTKQEVAKELPPLVRQVRWVDPDKTASLMYQRLRAGFAKGQLHAAIEATLKGKMPEALALAADAKQFLLTTWLRSHAAEMSRMLNEDDVPNVLITGDIPTTKRADLLRQAQAKKWGVVATLDSVTESLNLQGIAHIGIAHHIDPVPNKMAQMEGRLHRLGQTVGVVWYYVAMKNSADSIIVPHVTRKLDDIHAVMGGSRDMRNALGDNVDGAGQNEEEALAALYEEMKGGQHADEED